MPQKGQANQADKETLESNLIGLRSEVEALQREVRCKEKQMRNLIKNTLDEQEAERERISLEVHDGVTQTLASVFQHLQSLESTELKGAHAKQMLLQARALVKQAIQESRGVTNSLQPATLKDLGLVTTLRYEVEQLEGETGWKIDFKADAMRLPQNVETGLYRIIHEAINNARKHAQTKRLRVRMTSSVDLIRVEVRDWGAGFSYSCGEMSRGRGTGLLSMRRRAELLQGTCNIESTPGHGTVVSVEIPFSGRREQYG